MGISVEVGVGNEPGRNWWCPANRKDPQTLDFDHDSESDDGYSSGYLQQQSPPGRGAWWGGVFGDREGARRRMTLDLAADMFLDRLPDDYRRAAGNAQLAGELVQGVQGSAYPDRYRLRWDEAWMILRRALAGGPITEVPTVPVISGDPVWLEDVLRPALGDRLRVMDGWKGSGVGGFMADIRGIMWHHTGNSRATAQSIRDGRSDLRGPLSQIHIAPDGIVTIVAVGPCNHAGRGSWPWLPTNNANIHTIGIECAWPDIRPDGSFDKAQLWPDAQIISMRDVGAALTLHLGVGPERNIAHKEWAGAAQGKWDPGNLDMDWFRGEIAKDMRGEFDHLPEKPTPEQPPTTSEPDPPPILPKPANPRSDRLLLEEIRDQQRGPLGRGWPMLKDRTPVEALRDIEARQKLMDRKLDELAAQIAELTNDLSATITGKDVT